MFVPKMYRQVMFDGNEYWKQNLKENWLMLPIMTRVIWQIFTTAHSKVWNFGLLLGPFIQNIKYMSLKFKKKLCVTKMKNDTRIEENSNRQFKIDMKNLMIFHGSTWKSQKFAV